MAVKLKSEYQQNPNHILPSAPTSHSAPQFVELDVSLIKVDKSYQRDVNEKVVRRIVTEYNPDMMRPISVSLRDGKYYVWDGQHRLAAYKRLGMKTIPAMLTISMSYQEEAYLFAHQRDNTRNLTGVQRWKSSVAAGEEHSVRIAKICDSHGYTVGDTAAGTDTTFKCIAALEAAYDKLGDMTFSRMISVIADAYGYTANATSRAIVGGLARFIQIYDGDMSKPAQFDYDRLKKVLGSFGASGLLRLADTYKVGSIYSKTDSRVCRAIIELYNRRLKHGTLTYTQL